MMCPARLHEFGATRFWAIGVALPIIALGLATTWHNRQFHAAGSDPGQPDGSVSVQRNGSTLLIPSISEFDFGTLSKGGRHKANFCVRNPTTCAIEVARVTASCDCLHVTLAKQTISPGERVEATAEVDFSDDPSYSGVLLMEACGHEAAEATAAFVVSVKVAVR